MACTYTCSMLYYRMLLSPCTKCLPWNLLTPGHNYHDWDPAKDLENTTGIKPKGLSIHCPQLYQAHSDYPWPLSHCGRLQNIHPLINFGSNNHQTDHVIQQISHQRGVLRVLTMTTMTCLTSTGFALHYPHLFWSMDRPSLVVHFYSLPISALHNKEYKIIYTHTIQTFNKIQMQVFQVLY